MEVEGRRFIEHKPLGGYGTLNIVPRHVNLVAVCNSCGHAKEMERHVLDKAGLHTGLKDLSKRLRCYACGKKESKLLTGYFAEGD